MVNVVECLGKVDENCMNRLAFVYNIMPVMQHVY